MAPAVKGLAHWFGTGSKLSNATVLSISGSRGFDQEDTTKEEGVTIETRRDDRKKELSVTLRPQAGYSLPNQGAVVTLTNCVVSEYNGSYENVSDAASMGNDAHVEITLNLVQHEAITY